MAPPIASDTWERTVAGLAKLVERITPWLLDLGNWNFGALIAFNLLVLSALLTVGPVDKAVLIATATFALALPPDVAGFLLLRLAADMKSDDLEQVATQAFVDAGIDAHDIGPAPSPNKDLRNRAQFIHPYNYQHPVHDVLHT